MGRVLEPSSQCLRRSVDAGRRNLFTGRARPNGVAHRYFTCSAASSFMKASNASADFT